MTEVYVPTFDPSPLPQGVLPRRYGGDKLAFKAATVVETHREDAALIDSIRHAIEEYRNVKVQRKKEIEKDKEDQIRAAPSEAGKKRVLRLYHHRVLHNAGWFWEGNYTGSSASVGALTSL